MYFSVLNPSPISLFQSVPFTMTQWKFGIRNKEENVKIGGNQQKIFLSLGLPTTQRSCL